MKRVRPSPIEYYIGIAKATAQRSTCLRKLYGAVLVKNDEIIATGYNGAVRSEQNCCDKGECWRQKHNIPSGEQYEKCVGVHAEMNALLSAARKDTLDSTLYLYGYDLEKQEEILKPEPCSICSKLLLNAGVRRWLTASDYKGGH